MILHGISGFMGAFMFGGPNFVLCFKRCRKGGYQITECILELVTVLIVGAIAAGLLSLFVADIVRQTKPHQVTAVACLIGLFANPATPILIKLLSGKEMLKSVLEAILRAMGGKA